MTGLQALDRFTLAYVAAASLAFVWRLPASWSVASHYPLVHASFAGLALLAPWLRRRASWGRFLGDFYPLLLVVALYSEVGFLNRAVGLSHDATVQAWEQALFGGQPSRDWIRAWPHPWLSWSLHVAYLSYYSILMASPLGLWLLGDRCGARDAVCVTMVTFYACYGIFLLFPVAGPRYLFPLADNPATNIPIARFTQRLLNDRAAWGTAFPSSHVAASLVASVAALRSHRPMGVILLLFSVLLTVSTVYGQFHYAIDAIGGVFMALLIVSIAKWLTGPAVDNL